MYVCTSWSFPWCSAEFGLLPAEAAGHRAALLEVDFPWLWSVLEAINFKVVQVIKSLCHFYFRTDRPCGRHFSFGAGEKEYWQVDW